MNTADIVVKINGNLREDREYLKSIVEKDFYGLRDINISSDKTVIDLGAHIGMFSIYANKLFGCTAIAYEPEIQNYKRLEENIKKNKCTNIIIRHKGLWRDNYGASICLDPKKRSHDAHTLFKIKGWKTGGAIITESVQCVFDIGFKIIGYLKSNCQGGEYYLLKYFKNNPKILDRIDRMFIELHPHLMPEDKWLKTVQLVKWLKEEYKDPCKIQLAGVARKKYGNIGVEVNTF